MGDVAITYKILLENPEHAEKVLDNIKKEVPVKDAKIEELGFGIKVIKILVIIPDSEGNTVEDKIRGVEGVSEIEVESTTLV